MSPTAHWWGASPRWAARKRSPARDARDGDTAGPHPAEGTAMPIEVRARRVYDEPDPGDGYRVLIDHVWPRGVSKERAHLDEWARDMAPSDELRKWFDHVPERFGEFRARYRDELAG